MRDRNDYYYDEDFHNDNDGPGEPDASFGSSEGRNPDRDDLSWLELLEDDEQSWSVSIEEDDPSWRDPAEEETVREPDPWNHPGDFRTGYSRSRRGREGAAGRHDRKVRRGRSRRRRAAPEWMLIAVLAVVFLFSAYQVIRQLMIYQTASEEYEELSAYFEPIPETQAEEEVEDEGEEEEEDESAGDSLWAPSLNVDFAALEGVNSEFAGVIHIPVLDLTYPMAQASDNTFYLTVTFEGTENSSGCIFVDSAASPDFTDANTFVFGHNMKNKTMFGSLKLFQQEEDLCDSDPYIYIYLEERTLVYRIFAYYTIPVDDDVYSDFSGDDGYDDYVADAQLHSLYDPGEDAIDWTQRPNLLTLSTCYSTGHTHNFIVQAALLGEIV